MAAMLFMGCATTPTEPTREGTTNRRAAIAAAAEAARIRELEAALLALDGSVSAAEARAVAACAVPAARQLAESYRLVRPPWLHNAFVNLGLRQRGLCFQFAEDLAGRLEALPLKTLVLRWGISRPGEWREHNVVVVTARHQPFDQGLLLDPWSRSGRLEWQIVSRDRRPWQEGVLHPPSP
jgi:hypothetical protein